MALATLNVGVCVWELEEPNTPSSLRLVGCNPAAARFLGVKIEDVLGKRIHEGFPGSEKMPLPGLFTRVAETGQGMSLGDVPYVDDIVPDGVFSIHAHYQPPRRVCVEFTNVTEQRKAEKKVAAQHEELTRALSDLWGEMDLARKIQSVLLPPEQDIPGYEIAAEMRAASTVGGDYYDIFHKDGATWLLVGDVSGQGISAGLIMMMVQTSVRTALERADQPAPSEVLARVNASIRHNLQRIGRDQYMTITALRLDGGHVRHAGLHQDMLVYRAATGQVDVIETGGVWLGVVDDAAPLLRDGEFELHDGDVLLLFTDGLIEARRADVARGQERLVEELRRLAAAGTPARAMVKEILASAAEAGGSGAASPADDMAVLVARRRA
jgi:serine phosphatase RsbU (regulator of sigma subunit)